MIFVRLKLVFILSNANPGSAVLAPGHVKFHQFLPIMPPKSNRSKTRRRKNRSNRSSSSKSISNSKPATRGPKGTARSDQITTLPLLGNHFEDRRMLYYDNAFQLSHMSGFLTCYFFRANDLYDPDFSGTGHQPVGFDQAMLFWEQFCVFSSKISVRFMSNSSNAVVCGVFLSPDTVVPASIADLQQNGYIKQTMIMGATNDSTSGGGKHVLSSTSISMDSVRYFSSSNRETYFANPNFTGNAASSPTELVYFGIFAYTFNLSSMYDTYFDVTISYDARFWEPRKVASSLLHSLIQPILDEEKKKKESYEIVAPVRPPDDRKVALVRFR